MDNQQNTSPDQPEELTKEYVHELLISLFTELEEATGDTVATVTVLEHLRDGIREDPDFSRRILTPRNIEKVIELKRKSNDRSLKLTDIEEAFPEVTNTVPFWGLIKTFI